MYYRLLTLLDGMAQELIRVEKIVVQCLVLNCSNLFLKFLPCCRMSGKVKHDVDQRYRCSIVSWTEDADYV